MDLTRQEKWEVVKKALAGAFSVAIVAFPVLIASDALTNAQFTGNGNASETTIDWNKDAKIAADIALGVAVGGASIGTQVLRDERKKIAEAPKPLGGKPII